MLVALLLLLMAVAVAFTLMRIFRGDSTASALGALAVVAIAVVALAVLPGCRPQPAGPTIITNINNNTNTVNAGPGGVSDTGPQSGPVASCTLNLFGEPLRKTGAGACARGDKEIAVGCEQAATLNPRDKDGNVIFNEQVTGAIPESFSLAPGSDPSVASVRVGSESAYNRYITGLKPGILTFLGSVKGKTCTGAFTVVP